MAQQTRCPACGAPIEYSGNQDEVQCPYCGAHIQVVEEDGETHFQILGQPGPQKEVLSNPVEGGGGGADQPAADPGGAQVYPAGEPDQPASSAYGVNPYDQNRQVRNVPPGGGPVNVGVNSAGSSKTNRWIWITIAVIFAVCVLLACVTSIILNTLRTSHTF